MEEYRQNGTVYPAVESGKYRSYLTNKLSNGDQGEVVVDNAPPDGGTRAWLIMVASFLCNGILFGVVNSYGIIYVEFKHKFQEAGIEHAASKAALVGSLAIGTTFFLSPVAGILTDRIGIRRTTFLGGAIAAGGMCASSFLVDNVESLYFTYGIMFGLGASLAYTPSLVILGHYFEKYLGFVNGVVTAGSSVFTVIMPLVLQRIVPAYGIQFTLRFIAILVSGVMLCSLLFKPIKISSDQYKKQNVINLDIWKLPKYVIWAICIPVALFGYFVPYVHIKEYCNLNFPDSDGTLPVICIGITSGIGRLVFGYIADSPKVDRILLQQISFVSIGMLTILLPMTGSFFWLLVISLGMGLFDGCFISLLGPIAFDICGKDGASQAIGFLLGLCSFPLTIGPPIAGSIYESLHSYQVPFILAGIPPIIGAIVMFSVRCVKDKKVPDDYIQSSPIIGAKMNGSYNLESALVSQPLNGLQNGKISKIGVSYSNGIKHASTGIMFNSYSSTVDVASPLIPQKYHQTQT